MHDLMHSTGHGLPSFALLLVKSILKRMTFGHRAPGARLKLSCGASKGRGSFREEKQGFDVVLTTLRITLQRGNLFLFIGMHLQLRRMDLV